MSLLSWNVQSIEARRVGSVITALDVNRDLDSRFGPDEETIGPVATKSRAAPTRYRWRDRLSQGRDWPRVSWWHSSEDLVQSSFLFLKKLLLPKISTQSVREEHLEQEVGPAYLAGWRECSELEASPARRIAVQGAAQWTDQWTDPERPFQGLGPSHWSPLDLSHSRQAQSTSVMRNFSHQLFGYSEITKTQDKCLFLFLYFPDFKMSWCF